MRLYRKTVGLGLVALLIATALVACGQQPVEDATAGPDTPPAAEEATTGPGTPAADLSVEEHFQKGNDYIKNGQFDKAVAEFEAVLKADPERISALTNLGVAYYNVGRLDEAIAQYQKALEIGPDDADIHSNMAAAYVQKNDLVQGMAEYQKAIKINPELSQAHFGLAVVYLQQGQNDQASEELLKFQKYDDGMDPIATAQAYVYLGAIYLDEGELEKALVEYQKALQADPKLPSAHFGVGLVYAQLGQTDQAIKALEQFQEYDDGLNPTMTAQAYVYLGAIYLDKGEPEKALVEYQKALQVDPKLPAAHFGAGRAYAQLGQTDQAIKALEQFQQYDDGLDPTMTDQAAQLLKQLKGQ